MVGENANEDEIRDQIQQHVNEICALLDGEGGSMVTKFVIVLEALDSDGDYGVWGAVNKGAMCHQTLGLLNWQQARENEHIAGYERGN